MTTNVAVTQVALRHSKITLALHALREAQGPALLLLHGLGERSPETVPAALAAWPGAVHGLDFTGHGRSTLPAGGGYTAEVLMGDADAALAHLGRATIVGRGLGAYVGLLIAGARPEVVRGVVLCDGPGLAGGGSRPGSPRITAPDPGAVTPPDPFALAELSDDVRPPDYATSFVRSAVTMSELDWPVTVAAVGRPDWLAAVVGEPGVQVLALPAAIGHYATT